jgi:hypothetical protein
VTVNVAEELGELQRVVVHQEEPNEWEGGVGWFLDYVEVTKKSPVIGSHLIMVMGTGGAYILLDCTDILYENNILKISNILKLNKSCSAW